jgi:hypothetical protein
MLKAEFAELILSMALPPGSAASITGDLVEETRTRGPLWFWITLLRTAASASWRAFAEAPFRLAFWALAGLSGQFLCSIAISVPIAILMLSPFRMPFLESDRGNINLIVTTVGVAFLLGKWLGRNVPYRELPVYVIVSITPHIFMRLLTIWIELPAYDGSWMVGALAAAIGPIFTLAGIKRGRALAHRANGTWRAGSGN